MKPRLRFAWTLLPLALSLAAGAWAQKGAGAGRIFDPKTVETVSGKIDSIERVPHGGRGAQGVHFTLHTKGETLVVHLGPSWYLDKQEVQLAAKDAVTVRGSRVRLEGKPALIAAEVVKEGKTLKVRDAQGRPLWAGGRGR